MERSDVLVVGAGVAGLACARALALGGARPVVLERARGVGGRCATRRVHGRPVDHGIAFLHGDDPDLLADLDAVDAMALDGWPHRVHGEGAACQPAAFHGRQRRLAFDVGVTAFPKHLARGLDARLGMRVTRLAAVNDAVEVETEGGGIYGAPTVVLALALEQSWKLLDAIAAAGDEFRAVLRLLSTMATAPSLTVLAGYPRRNDAPPWDIAYPEESSVLQLVSHDTTKRPKAPQTTLVMQARPAWSRTHSDDPPASWSAAMLAEAGRLYGSWMTQPDWKQNHTWHHARLEAGNELAAPVLLTLGGGGRIGLAGELFSPGGGLQSAYRSGRRLAARLTSSNS